MGITFTIKKTPLNFFNEVEKDEAFLWLRLNESSGDAINTGTDGGSFNAVNITRPVEGGLVNSADTAYGFNGSNSQVFLSQYGRASLFSDPTGSDITWENLFYRTTSGGNDSIWSFSDVTPSNDWFFYMRITSGNVAQFVIDNGPTGGGGTVTITGTTPIADNTWYHLVGVLDNTVNNEIRLYLNGKLEAGPGSLAGFGTYGAGHGPEQGALGRRRGAGGNTEYFPGRLDEALVYDKILPADRIKVHSKAALG